MQNSEILNSVLARASVYFNGPRIQYCVMHMEYLGVEVVLKYLNGFTAYFQGRGTTRCIHIHNVPLEFANIGLLFFCLYYPSVEGGRIAYLPKKLQMKMSHTQPTGRNAGHTRKQTSFRTILLRNLRPDTVRNNR